MKIPCEECIRYAICKQKISVECNSLTEFFNRINDKRNSKKGVKDKAWDETWSIIRQDLPNLKGIYTETLTSQYTGISGKVDYGRVSY